MKKILTVSIIAIMLILMTITGVSATTNDTLPSTIYSMCSPYGMRESDKVKVEMYLADYHVSDAQAN